MSCSEFIYSIISWNEYLFVFISKWTVIQIKHISKWTLIPSVYSKQLCILANKHLFFRVYQLSDTYAVLHVLRNRSMYLMSRPYM